MPALVQGSPLRVCADPNNLPFSNQAGEGFENRLAELVARDLGRELQYAWWSERKAFVRNSLLSDKCDVLLGIASSVEDVLATQPYYRSTYVFVTKQGGIRPQSLLDEKLAKLRIGLHVVDNDYAPPARVLAKQGLGANLVPYSLFGAYGEPNPPANLISAVEHGDVDVAIIWGPFAGYFAKSARVPLQITPVNPPAWMGVPFQFDISMAVRPQDGALKQDLDRVLVKECAAIQAVLADYGVPTIPEEEPQCAGLMRQHSASSH